MRSVRHYPTRSRPMTTEADRDGRYVDILLAPLRESARYTPKFGQGKGKGLSLDQFRDRYGADPLYSWIGFDNPLMYAAHKAAGGMTSLYRQLGIGCERLFRQILRDQFRLEDAQVRWSYTLPGELGPEEANEEEMAGNGDDMQLAIGGTKETTSMGKSRTLTLDGRLAILDILDEEQRVRVRSWINANMTALGVETPVDGAVFEVRQGYKSKDAKRQNADLANATQAYTKRYLPVVVVFSNQIDEDVAKRYREGLWGVLRGDVMENDPTKSTFAFCEQILQYNLVGFFRRSADELRTQVADILEALLTPHNE
jgi:hypothetical protein